MRSESRRKKMDTKPDRFLNKNVILSEAKNLKRCFAIAQHDKLTTSKSLGRAGLFLILTFNFLLLTSPKAFADYDFGCNYAVTTIIGKNLGSGAVNSRRGVAFAFTPIQTGYIDQISILTQGSSSGQFCVGIAEVLNNVNPFASQVWLASATVAYATKTNPRWQDINLAPVSPSGSGADISDTNVKYIVIFADQGSDTGNGIFYGLPQVKKRPKNLSADDNLDVSFCKSGSAGSWAGLTATPLFVIKYSDGKYQSTPYSMFISTEADAAAENPLIFSTAWKINGSVYGTRALAFRFTPATDRGIVQASVYVKKIGTTLTDALKIRVVDSSDNLVIDSTTFAVSGEVTSVGGWVTKAFAGKKLSGGTAHRFYFFIDPTDPGTSDVNNCYEIAAMSPKDESGLASEIRSSMTYSLSGFTGD
ncbi:MAG TPA: hypothetical protein DCX95_03810, partial [Elusimicrobia bacterium]|nr:hypothetical protein [Elusimicrobiota bacterium]